MIVRELQWLYSHIVECLPPNLETNCDLWEWLDAAVVVPDRSCDVGLLQELPLPIGHIIAQIYNRSPTNNVHLEEATRKEREKRELLEIETTPRYVPPAHAPFPNRSNCCCLLLLLLLLLWFVVVWAASVRFVGSWVFFALVSGKACVTSNL